MESIMRGAKQSGHTLIEVVAVLAVAGMLAAVAMIHSSNLSADAFSDAETLKSALRETRTRAMADISSWTLTVAGQTGTLSRGGVNKSTVTFTTAGVAAGATTFDTKGVPSGTLSYAVTHYSGSTVTITAGTGLVQ